jgi:hypothetical protein
MIIESPNQRIEAPRRAPRARAGRGASGAAGSAGPHGAGQQAEQARRASAREGRVPPPPSRRLRGYAFDPSLSIELETAVLNEVVFKVKWEDALDEGPVGEYVEVVDYDPASNCYYAPVDLDDPLLLAQDGLPPSEGNPQFHQQMVYAVAMTTIRNFERALGRFALWSPHLYRAKGGDVREEYVGRLRIYPHALREPNAYYSPPKKALLFGYFPASSDSPGTHFPGGTVFTCLSHDIVAHETTHALLDGMHRRFIEPTHPDVRAFHEGFADIVALFQRFSFPEVLRHQIGRTRGDLATQNLLGELAQQFGKATGQYGALRSAIGRVNPDTGRWEPLTPDPKDYQTVFEPHDRGAILVAAVFDAFLSIYKSRVADLLRIASSGTGILPEGALHPDLVNRLAEQAAKAAQHVLNACIRALDYCPPVDITFGDYLRALITADSDIVPDDDRGYRVAFIEAFRRRGIYPRDVRTLSVESLRWPSVREEEYDGQFERALQSISEKLRKFSDEVRYLPDRRTAHEETRKLRGRLHRLLGEELTGLPAMQQMQLTGLLLSADSPLLSKGELAEFDLDRDGRPLFEIHSLRPAQQVGPDGERLNQVVITITQKRNIDVGGGLTVPFRGGCNLILDLNTFDLRYHIVKPVLDPQRQERQIKFLRDSVGTLRATYLGDTDETEPFAALHREYDRGGLL